MRAIILAAGKGSRLKAGYLPKPLAKLATGQSILQYQLDILIKYVPLDDIRVVVGYHKEEIMEAFPYLNYVHNPDFDKENTSKSLLKGIEKWENDLLWINGDVVFHSKVLQTLFTYSKTCMIVNQSDVGEEEVKYRQDEQGKILEVSKKVKHPNGEALGINYFEKKDIKKLCHQLNQCQPHDYFEQAIQACIDEGMDVWANRVDQHLCAEIDFPDDLNRANQLLSSW